MCHLEERMDWDIAGLTGTEIYNTHADFKDETKFLAALRSPLTLLQPGPGGETVSAGDVRGAAKTTRPII